MLKTNSWEAIFPILLVLLMLASRIPLVTGDYFKADGDEAIVGLMAKEIVDHGDFKVYFWGQQYGFVTFETSAAAIAFKLFGVNAYALKITMLLLWIVGALFLYFAIKRVSGPEVAMTFALTLAACPAWGLWSMKARGGYITAWLFSGITAWCLGKIYHHPGKKLIIYWIATGISIAIIYFAQKLWLFSLAPFIVFVFVKRRNIISLLVFAVSVLGTTWLISFFARHENLNFWLYDDNYQTNILNKIPWIIPRFFRHFSGSYYLGKEYFAGVFNSAGATIWMCIFFTLSLLQLYRLVARKFYVLSHLSYIAIWLGAVSIFTADGYWFNYRYLLPVDAPLLLCFASESCYWAGKFKWKKIPVSLFTLFLAVNFAGLYQLRNISTEFIFDKPTLSFNESMKQAISYCLDRHIYYTFATDPFVFWETDFYSNKKVLSRYINGSDRKPDYVKPVTVAFHSGKPTAILDSYYATEFNPRSPAPGIDLAKVVVFGNQIKVYLYPDRKTLENLGFDLK